MLFRLVEEFNTSAEPREVDVVVEGVVVIGKVQSGLNELLEEAEQMVALGVDEGGVEDGE